MQVRRQSWEKAINGGLMKDLEVMTLAKRSRKSTNQIQMDENTLKITNTF
jgi:hypothetical protein